VKGKVRLEPKLLVLSKFIRQVLSHVTSAYRARPFILANGLVTGCSIGQFEIFRGAASHNDAGALAGVGSLFPLFFSAASLSLRRQKKDLRRKKKISRQERALITEGE